MRIAERRLARDLKRVWIPDDLCDDWMAEFSGSPLVARELTDEELAAYKEFAANAE